MEHQEINEIICHIDGGEGEHSIAPKLSKVWGKYMAYHIHNVQSSNYTSLYENLAESLGTIRMCNASNDPLTPFSKSRDIRVDPTLYKYFASSTKQPLHTDYAFYRETDRPDWLMLFCITPSEFGGLTHLLSTKTLVAILEKYNPKLLDKLYININWSYTGSDGEFQHSKPLLKGMEMNWNYWQIKEELNSSDVMNVRQEFRDFLKEVIEEGNIYDFEKKWNTGDCIIFNDRLMLHGRDAFLGTERWLKDFAFLG